MPAAWSKVEAFIRPFREMVILKARRRVIRRGITAIALSLTVQGMLWGQGASEEPPANEEMTAETPPDLPSCPPCVPWDSRTAGHLMRRAGFSASPEELERLMDIGFEATLDELLNHEAVDDTEMEEGLEEQNYPFTRLNANGRIRPNTSGMQHWWLYRMVNSRRQLLEKMTYFWHDHFATSVSTVRQVGIGAKPYMMAQNELLREYALGNFKEMVTRIARDPAMLVWLDNRSNVKDHPNENWSRELLELFTMGEGNYTDQDVVEAARAFTGWGLNRRGAFHFFPGRHDFGAKTFLNRSGAFDGDDIIDIIFEQDATAEFISRKLFAFFVHPDPPEELIAELADVFRQNDYEIRPLMRAIFEHPEFYSDRAYRSLIKSPADLFVGLFRELGKSDTVFLPRFMASTGQELFAPPDVSGWTSGVGWINTSTLLARYNAFNILTSHLGRGALYFVGWVQTYQLSPSDVVGHLLDAIVKDDVSMHTRHVLRQYMTTDDSGGTAEWDFDDAVMIDKKARGVLYLILAHPAYQLH